MKILALELSAELRGAAVLDTETGRVGAALETRARHTKVFALAEEALAQAGIKREEIERIAVGIGPGSYTGIRMAISAAQGWHLAAGTSLVAISSLEVLAGTAQAQGWQGEVDFIVDAQRGEFYLASYTWEQGIGREVLPLHLAGKPLVQARLDQGRRVAGPDARRYFAGAEDLFPDAAVLARLAAMKTETVAPEALEPIYLRVTNFVKAPPPRVVA